MICNICNSKEADFVAPCKHSFHGKCLIGSELCCSECRKSFSTFDLFWDILRDAKMTRNEHYYKKLSGCSNVMRGLLRRLIDNDKDGKVFKKIRERSNLFISFFKVVSIEKMLLEESLLKNNLRLARLSITRNQLIKIDRNILLIVRERDHIEILAEAFDQGMIFYYSYEYFDPLFSAAENLDVNLLQRLIDIKIDLNRRSANALYTAFSSTKSFGDQFKFIERLVENGVSLNDMDMENLFRMGIKYRNVYLVKFLIEKGNMPQQEEMMEWAIKMASVEIVKLLHEYGLKFNQKDRYSVPSSLHCACIF